MPQRKAHVNKGIEGEVFFGVVDMYDMLWTEGLLIKLHGIGVTGKIFIWVMDFANERTEGGSRVNSAVLNMGHCRGRGLTAELP